MVRIRRALVSVSDKSGLPSLAKSLSALGVEILSTGGTAKLLREAGVLVIDVSAYTGAPEILDGRVKTLHPRIHGGLLGRPTDSHRAEMARHDIGAIDLVVVNLYPFRQTVAKAGVEFGDAIENIDIGGPSMIRSAAKNHERVAVVVDPSDYAALEKELAATGGQVSADLRFQLARKAFAHTAAYDGAIANWLGGLPESPAPAPDAVVQPGPFPTTLSLQWTGGQTLRYGENPHQKAAIYRDGTTPAGPTVVGADVLQGKELSFNNLVDLDAALELVLEFERPAVAIIKHNNPCGTAETDAGVAAAFELAKACDPVSAFGGVIAVNRVVDEAAAVKMAELFLECVIAPGFTDGARAAFEGKKNLRLLAFGEHRMKARATMPFTIRTLPGGLLVQTPDDALVAAKDAKVVTKRAPTDEELRALDFAWRVAKHVKSNAIVYARAIEGGAVTVGIGAGQMSRVDSARLGVEKARSPVAGCVAASDAFFPFRDGLDQLAQAGATAVIQPGGSVRDPEVVGAADEHGLAMVFTGMRHFRH